MRTSSILLSSLGLSAHAQGLMMPSPSGSPLCQTSHYFGDDETSKTYPSDSGRMRGPVSRVRCKGEYCGVLMIEAQLSPSGEADIVNNDKATWTEWFSDDRSDGAADCKLGWVVTNIQCSSKHCDDKRLQCSPLTAGYRTTETEFNLPIPGSSPIVIPDIKKTDWFSEESWGWTRCPNGYYLAGMRCDDDYCDKIKLSCVGIERVDQPSTPCGNGKVGNGKCANDGLCCSRGGWCGYTEAHCQSWSYGPTKMLSPCGFKNKGTGSCPSGKGSCMSNGECTGTAWSTVIPISGSSQFRSYTSREFGDVIRGCNHKNTGNPTHKGPNNMYKAWTSEIMAGPISGVRCFGDNCSSMKLTAVIARGPGGDFSKPIVEISGKVDGTVYEAAFPSGFIFGDGYRSGFWTHEISEEGPTLAICPSGEVMNGVKCKDENCDKKKISCGTLTEGYKLEGPIVTTGWFSEEGTGRGYCPVGNYVVGMECQGGDNGYCDNQRLHCQHVLRSAVDALAFAPGPIDTMTDREVATKFAPMIVFDHNSRQFPMPWTAYMDSSVSFYDSQRDAQVMFAYTSFSEYNPEKMGISYEVKRCAGKVSIAYWSMYRGQKACVGSTGKHEGDWERIIVDVDLNLESVISVVYFQHKGSYRVYPSKVRIFGGTHVVSYVGKSSNGQYHFPGGFYNGLSGLCQYWDDFRNVKDSNRLYKPWKYANLPEALTEIPTFTGFWGRDKIAGPRGSEREQIDICNPRTGVALLGLSGSNCDRE